jgi:hypothetical protein
MTRRTRFLWVVAAFVGALNGGCGTSGSRPAVYPEVRFEVQPRPATVAFRVDELVAGGVRHTFPADTVFTATNTFFFYLENAPPPYSGTFTVCTVDGRCPATDTSGNNIHVKLFVPGPTEAREFNADTDAPGITQATVASGSSPVVTPPTQEVRFDVCVSSAGSATCSATGDAGAFDLTFSGNLGDALQTHLLVSPDGTYPRTPSIYFLENAQDSVNAVFRLAPTTGQTLVARLFINGALQQTQSGTKDVIIRQDL